LGSNLGKEILKVKSSINKKEKEMKGAKAMMKFLEIYRYKPLLRLSKYLNSFSN